MYTVSLDLFNCKPLRYPSGSIINWIITSGKEVMFLYGFVCEFMSLFVNKITQKLMDGF